jgi:pyrroloquinoline quinone (PQQ) biosynthesis protein C
MGRNADNGIVQVEAVLMDTATLRRRLQHVGETMYHHLYPFRLRMHAGELTRGQMQAWF